MKSEVKKSKLFSKNKSNNQIKKENSPELEDKFVIEDFQNQDQGEEFNNNLVVRMDKSRRNLYKFNKNIYISYNNRHWLCIQPRREY